MMMSPVLLMFLMHLFNDTSSESDFVGFAPAEIEASMMPTVGDRVDSSEDDMGENHEGEGRPAPDESDSDIDQAPVDGLDADGGVRSTAERVRNIELIFYPNYYNLLKFSVT